MNNKDKEAYALLDAYRLEAMIYADDCLKDIANYTGFVDYKQLRDSPDDIDDAISHSLGNSLASTKVYSLAIAYDRFMFMVHYMEYAMFKLSDGNAAFDVDLKNFDAEKIEESIDEDQSKEFKEFIDGLRGY